MKTKKSRILTLTLALLTVLTLSLTACSNASERGNTMGNLANGGYFAQQGDWIYYLHGGLQRVRTDGTGAADMIKDSSPGGLNVVGDWVYAFDTRRMTIGKAEVDSQKERRAYDALIAYRSDDIDDFDEFTDGFDWLYIEGDWIYYVNVNDEFTLYKIKLDLTGKQKLTDVNSVNVSIAGGWIYYVDYNNRSGSWDFNLHKVRTDGTDNQLLHRGNDIIFSNITVDGDWIYFGGQLSRIRTDGTDAQSLYDEADVNKFNVSGDRVFFDVGQTLYSIRTDGTDLREISDDWESSSGIHIFGDWIYFVGGWGSRVPYKMRLDGSDLQELIK